MSRVSWIGGPSVYYNLSFAPTKPPPQLSSSLRLRPDIAVSCTRGDHPELHVFDAKLRIDGGVLRSRDDAAQDDEEEGGALSFKKDDLAKMHAYRDALPYVRSARVLYPGDDEARDFPSLASGAREHDVVGAIPLTPGKASGALVAVLARALGGEGR